jgi:voltage-gated potassium channel
MRSMEMKKRIHQLLFLPSDNDALHLIVDWGIMILIALNVAAVMLETVEGLFTPYATLLWHFEVFSVAVFTVEYFLRLWVCTCDKRYAHPVRGRLRYALSFFGLVDLAAIAPFYLPVLLPVDLREIRAVRLFRLFRAMKMVRYSKALQMMGRAIGRRREELTIVALAVLMLLVLASSMMYFAEHDAQPKVFSSIPASLWWGVVTLTTIGYGDIYPVTPLGKLFGAVIAFLSIGMFALPAGILSSSFMEEVQQRKEDQQEPKKCPHCGKDL